MQVLLAILAGLAALALYGWVCFLVVVHLFWPSAPYLVLGGAAIGVVLVGWVVVGTLIGVGGFGPRTVGPTDVNDQARFPPTGTPFRRDRAWPHYLVAQAREDLRTAARNIADAVASWWRVGSSPLRSEPGIWWAWPFLIFPLLVLVSITVVAAGAGVVVLLLCVAVLVCAWLVWIIVGAATRAVDRGVRLRRGARGSCPHSGCNEVTDLPSYRCACGAIHRDIRAGRLGALSRRCSCNRVLPTTVMRAGTAMQTLCPRCDKPMLPGAATITDVRLPVLGPVSAGKTRFVSAGLVALCRHLHTAGGQFVPADERSVETIRLSIELVSTGAPTSKTLPDRPPGAISARVTAGSSDGLLHLFDAAGEFFAHREQVRMLNFLDEAQGFVLVIDPFSIRDVVDELSGPLGAKLQDANPAHGEPEASYRIATKHLSDCGVRLERRALAVTVVKADLLLELPPGAQLAVTADDVRSWLWKRGLRNLVRSAERDFGAVRYFLVSSQTGWRAEDPLTAAAPLLWLADQAGLPLPPLPTVVPV